jgi:glucosamine 6-phosphate synthetase-like amidotransferase/phosphosugar isomerase protein
LYIVKGKTKMKENTKFWFGIVLTIFLNAIMIAYSYGTINTRVAALEKGVEKIDKKLEAVIELSERIARIEAKIE